MKVKSLRLKNYRIHKDSTLQIGDASLVFIRGKNMSGKTSFAEGLSMNLAGTTVSLANDGKGFKAKISQGEKEAIITAEIQGKHILRNTKKLSLGVGGGPSEIECLDVDDEDVVNNFKNFLKDRRSALLIALNTDYFARLEEKDQANLLAKLVLPSHHNFPKDKVDAVHTMLGANTINWDENPFDVIAKAYKALYEKRKEINVKVRDFIIPDAINAPKDMDLESLQVSVEEARKEKAKIQSERDAAVAKANETEVKRGKLQTKIDGLRAEVDKGKKRLAELEATTIEPEALSRHHAVAEKKSALDALNSQHAGLLAAIRTVGAQIQRLKDIAGKGATCPTCDQAIDAAKLSALITELEKERAGSDAKIQELDKQIESIGNVQAALDAIKKDDDAMKEIAKIKNDLTETVRVGKDTRKELEALPEKVDATAPFTKPLADIEAKITTILETLGPVAAAEQRAKDIKEKTEQLEKLKVKADALDMLVKYFDKDGVKAELIKAYIGGFESKLKSVLSAWGYEASLSEGLDFEVTTKRGYVGPVKEISGAEEFIFNAALQCAVSIAAGINMVVIDEVEELGEDIRPFLFRTIFSLIQDGKLEQAILIGFSLDKNLPKPQAPNSKYFYVDEGTVEELR